jgi:hypothetical protein
MHSGIVPVIHDLNIRDFSPEKRIRTAIVLPV